LADATAPYIRKDPNGAKAEFKFIGYDRRSHMCSFLTFTKGSFVSVVATTGVNASYSVPTMAKIQLDLRKGILKYLDVFMPRGFWSVALKTVQDTSLVREYICGIMEGGCSQFLPLNSTFDCVRKLELLPYHTFTADDNVLRYEGNSLSCRALHSVLASKSADNAKRHCPHVSFVPVEDPKGVIKCQDGSGANYKHSDLFTGAQLKDFTEYMKRQGFNPEIDNSFQK
jgi:hypothetical protein